MSAFPGQLDMVLRLCVPYGVMVVLFILNTMTLSFPLTGSAEAPLLLMAIYYWSVYRPTLVPVWLVFAAGLLFDLLSGLPVGLHAFIFIVVRWLVTDQRLFLTGQPFVTFWIGFALVSTGAIFAQWALFGLIQWQWTPPGASVVMVALGIFLFPFIMMVLHVTHKVLSYLPNQYRAVK